MNSNLGVGGSPLKVYGADGKFIVGGQIAASYGAATFRQTSVDDFSNVPHNYDSHLKQRIEAYRLVNLGINTTNPRPMMLSFMAQATNPGIYNVELTWRSDPMYHYVAQYTITHSNTWEFFQIRIPPLTDSVYMDTDAMHDYNFYMDVSFKVGMGADYTNGDISTEWRSRNVANIAPNQTLAFQHKDDRWSVSRVQLEIILNDVNDTGESTPFEYRPEGIDKVECSRYLTSGARALLFMCQTDGTMISESISINDHMRPVSGSASAFITLNSLTMGCVATGWHYQDYLGVGTISWDGYTPNIRSFYVQIPVSGAVKGDTGRGTIEWLFENEKHYT
jgi:hypothetical protein